MHKKYNQGAWSLMSQRQRMSPFPNYMSMESVCKEMKQFVGTTLRDILIFFQGNIMFCFQHTQSHEQAGSAIVKRIIRNPKLYAGLVKKQHGYGSDLVNFTKHAGQVVKRGKSTPKQLVDFFAGYEKRYKMVYASYGSVWTMEDDLQAELYKIIQKRVPDANEISRVINTMTKQPLAMVATIERKALLTLAATIQKNKVWKDAVTAGIVEGVKAIKPLDALIKKHERAFYWITRDYEDPILTYEKIVERFRVYLATDPAAELTKLTKSLAADVAQRKAHERALKLTKKELALFAAMRDAAHLKELRKKYVSQSLYHFDPVLTEIGKRLFLSIKQVRFMSTADVEKALLKDVDYTEELNNRMKLSLWHIVNGSQTLIVTGKKAEEQFKIFCTPDKNATEFSGMPVSPGVARGPAKIVLDPNQCDKVEKGDIIVSIQVVPSFSTAIIKSAGIVCDGGHGITSHPATLAREAKIPCVIQTRFAREVIKDGDIIEVDGYKGIVKLIEKK